VLKRIWWVLAVAGLASAINFVVVLYLNNDEVLDCKLKQWMAGGKKPPDMDLLSNITFRRDNNDIIADFRALQKNWSDICLTTVYAPDWPYLHRGDADIRFWSTNARTIGCFAGDDHSQLTLMLNSHARESEYHRISIPLRLLDRAEGPVLDTDYRTPEPPKGHYQCSDTSTAVATCLRSPTASPNYCLLYFHR